MNNPQKVAADRLQTQGIQQAKARDFIGAVQHLEQALEAYRAIGDRQGEGSVLANLGLAHHFLCHYEQALQYHQMGLQLEHQSLGEQALQDEDNSEYLLDKFIDNRKIGTRRSWACVQFNLAVNYYWLNDYVQSLKHYQLSLEAIQQLGDRPNECLVLGQMGEVYFYIGDYLKSIDYYQKALQIGKELNYPLGQGVSLNSLGNVYSMLKKLDEAIESYEAALPFLRQVGAMNGEGNALAGIAVIYAKQKKYEQALPYFEQSLALYQRQGIRYNEAITLGYLGQICLSQGNYEKAIQYHQKSLDLAQEINEIYAQAAAHKFLAFALLKSGELEQAEAHFRASIDIAEAIRDKLGSEDSYKISFFDRQAEPYQALQYVLVEQEKVAEALEISERSRTRALIDLLAQDPRLSNSQQHFSCFPNIGEIQAIAIAQQSTIVEYSLLEIQELQPIKLLIWIINPKGRVHLRVSKMGLEDESSALSDLVQEARQSLGIQTQLLRDAGDELQPPIANPHPHETVALKKLYHYLIEPVADLLPSNPDEPVIFVPHRDLFLVPFAALQDPQTGTFLLDRHTLVTVPSIQVLQAIEQRQTPDTEVSFRASLVVGNPTMPSLQLEANTPPQPLRPLPAAEVEAIALAHLLKTVALIGDQATKACVLEQLPDAQLVHFGTHGLLDDIRQLGIPGAIALAPGLEADGFLTASDLFNRYGVQNGTALRAQLAVLSACSTGIGKIAGDGVIGLSRALLAAGVPRLVVSLWSIHDLSTAFLMTQFYKNLLSLGKVAESLRNAQQWLRNANKDTLKQAVEELPLTAEQKRIFRLQFLRPLKSDEAPFASPYYWAAFHTIGDNKPISLKI